MTKTSHNCGETIFAAAYHQQRMRGAMLLNAQITIEGMLTRMRARADKFLATVLLLPFVALGQAGSPGAGFDVISIKQSVDQRGNEITPGLQHGRLQFRNVTVQAVMSLAFSPLNFAHIKGNPSWTNIGIGTRYDIEATSEEREVTEERYHQMLQKLLVDRFGLKFHWETHDEPVYLLVVDNKGLKLKTTDPASCVPVQPGVTLLSNATSCGQPWGFTPIPNGLHFEGIGMTMKALAMVLSLSGMTVIDRTGHDGFVDVKLDFMPPNRLSTVAGDAPPSIFDAVRDQLGLRLQPGTGPVDEVIIDHIERPSEN